MEFIWLEDFLALVDSGNFSRAAELRHVTQPAFSRRIRALEDWVGVDLFERDSHPVTLTEAGHRFRPVAEELLRRLLQGREEARQADHNAAAKLKFAVTHALLLKFLFRLAWLEPMFTSHLSAALKAMAQDGRGVALLPLSLVSDDLANGSLVRAGDESWDTFLEIRLLRPHSSQKPAAEKFWSLVSSQAG